MASGEALPSLAEIAASSGAPDSPLANALSVLFEPSPVLFTHLVPDLSSRNLAPESYASLIDAATAAISAWDSTTRAAFTAAHPRIGEVNNLSRLSQKEQASKATPPDVLVRLAQLNEAYEARYPGLRYITFVNGRSRQDIRDEMEAKLSGTGAGKEIGPVDVDGEEWRAELERAIADIGRIAKSRLRALGTA
ncbi:Oxo-4-hydroxy-4-carboxy-5-ureidoimidazoline decarboxylase [Hysterangium stoloniferum]|nr:Oxo-4-hydroxy-4-carboxy-5-ureidoimidazoline decarboxylase [Hysterangium stoloniferum]